MAIGAYHLVNFIGILFGVYLTLYWLQRNGTRALAVQPLVWFSLFFSLIHFITPSYKLVIRQYRYMTGYGESTLLLNAILSLAVFCFCAAILARITTSQPPPSVAKSCNGPLHCVYSGIAGAVIALFSMFQVEQAIATIGYDNFASDRILASSQMGLYSRLDILILPSLALFFAGILNIKRKKSPLYALLVLIIIYSVRYFSLVQSRNSILLMFVIMVSIYCFYRPLQIRLSRTSFRIWLLGGVGILLLGYFAYATTIMRYESINHSYAQEKLDNLFYHIIDGSFGNDENLLWLTENDPDLLWGRTYLSGITNLVPRALWPDKPWGAGPELKNMIVPRSYVAGAEGNSSITTGFLTEARMNFGIPGIFLVGMMWALVLRWLHRALRRSQTVFRETLIIYAQVLAATAFVYAEFLGFFSNLMLCVIAMVLLRTVLAIVFKSNRPWVERYA